MIRAGSAEGEALSSITHRQTDRQQQSLDLLGPFSDELQSLPVWAMTPASLLCVRILSYNCVTVQTDLYVTDKAVLRQQRRAAMPEVVAVEQNRAWLIAHRNLSLIQRRTKGAVIYLIRVHSAFVELPQEAFRQVPLRGS